LEEKITQDKTEKNLATDLKKNEWQLDAKMRELQEQMKILEDSRTALMNMLEDMEDLRRKAEEEKEKTLAIINNFADGLILFDVNDCCTLIKSSNGG